MPKSLIRVGLEGLNPSKWQKGLLWAPPTKLVMLPYNVIGGDVRSVNLGADILAQTIINEFNSGATEVDVYGHSVRAQVIDRCLTKHHNTVLKDIPRDKFRCLLAADPEHPFNGLIKSSQYGSLGVPSNCTVECWWMTRQYDPLSDWVNNTFNLNAMSQFSPWFGGKMVPMGPAFWKTHLAYDNWPFFAPIGANTGYKTWHHPNRPWHFVYASTYPLPSLQSTPENQIPYKDPWLRFNDQVLRSGPSGVEAAYTTRPVSLPMPDYANLPTTGIPFPSAA